MGTTPRYSIIVKLPPLQIALWGCVFLSHNYEKLKLGNVARKLGKIAIGTLKIAVIFSFSLNKKKNKLTKRNYRLSKK